MGLLGALKQLISSPVYTGDPTIVAKAPNLPPPANTNTYNIMPPFGVNPPGPTVGVTIPEDMSERLITNDPRELWYLALPNKLTPQQCLTILRSALGGDIWQQWQLVSLMLDTWPVFRSASHQLRDATSYCRFKMSAFVEDEGEEPTPSAQDKAKLVSRALRGMKPNQFNDERNQQGTVYDMTDAMLNGLSLQEVMWEERVSKTHGRERMPRATAWVHPRHFTFTDDGFIAVFDDDYARLYANPLLSGQPTRTAPDPNKFICSQFISRSGSSLGAGFMRPLAMYWAARQFNWEWMLEAAKKFGTPFLDVTYSADTDDAALLKLDAYLKQAAAAGRIRHREGTKVEITQGMQMTADNPQRHIQDEADKMALLLLLGQEGTTKSTPGKLGGQDGTHENVKAERIQALANWTAAHPLTHFARAVIRMNYGTDDETPTIVPDFTEPMDAGTVGTFAQAISTSNMPVPAEDFYAKIGMRMPEEDEVVLVGGKLVKLGAIQNQDDIAEQQALQMQQGGQDPEDPDKKPFQPKSGNPVNARKARARKARIARALARASKEDLAKLEELIVAAEKAPHRNGEYRAVQVHIQNLTRQTL